MKVNALRAALVVAAVYGFFLIFAQFAFVELLRGGGASLMQEKIALGAMALAGIAGGFFAAWRVASPQMIRSALGTAAVSSFLAPYATAFPSALGIACLAGLALGVATVSLAAILPAWCRVAWIGLGTGMGYAVCNFPVIFELAPAGQAWAGTVFAIIGLLAVPAARDWDETKSSKAFPFWCAIALFTALVWLDSAAFFIIQHSSVIKHGTWGSGLLWRNAAVHLSVAIAAGFWLACGGARMLPALAWVVLAVAALAVNGESTREIGAWLYPAGVSLYSAALVAWPSWFSGAEGCRKAGWRAAWLFAVAGWFGSANGIGMAQTLHRIPLEFVVVSGGLVAVMMFLAHVRHWRSVVVVVLLLLVCVLFRRDDRAVVGDAFERGGQVYLSEGCIHCHSQYVRPGSLDEKIWGPVRSVEELLGDEPVLIGNRRQGPDLTNVGARRSAAWLKLHFLDPRKLAPGSSMPSYGHLFQDSRGDDLVRYLKQAGEGKMGDVVATAAKWEFKGEAEGYDGKALFMMHCAACHGPSGLGDGAISRELAKPPANLVNGPFVWTPAGDGLGLRVARAIKFGLPNTDMPGHEVLTDAEILALRDFVLHLRGVQ